MNRTVGFKLGFGHAPSARVKRYSNLRHSKIRIAEARVGFKAANRESFPYIMHIVDEPRKFSPSNVMTYTVSIPCQLTTSMCNILIFLSMLPRYASDIYNKYIRILIYHQTTYLLGYALIIVFETVYKNITLKLNYVKLSRYTVVCQRARNKKYAKPRKNMRRHTSVLFTRPVKYIADFSPS